MSELATIARPYAEAVFKRAKETKTSKKWSEMLSFLAVLISDNDISTLLDNPKVSKDRLIKLLLDISQEQVNTEGANFLKILLQNNRLFIIPVIADIYEDYKAEDEGYIEVDLLTAYSLTKEEERKMTAILENSFQKQVHINITVDKSLIGGVFVRAGDHVIDGSIKGRLQQLAKQL